MAAGALGSPFVAKLSNAGAPAWARAFTGTYIPEIGGVAAGPNGEVALAFSSLETVDFGDGALTSKRAHDIFVGKYASGGTVAWGRQYGDTASQDAGPLAITPAGEVVIAAQVKGTVDFGKGPLTATAGDVVIAKLAP